MIRILWVIFGLLSLGLGAVGAVLPLLPTVPLLLLSAFCFAQSSENLHNWLLSHKYFGPPIHDWNQRRAISLQAKRLATLSILAAFLIPWFVGVRAMILLIQGAVLVCVLLFIWTRPNA